MRRTPCKRPPARLRRTPTSDADVDALLQITSLEEIDLSDTAVTETGIERILTLPRLRTLKVTEETCTMEALREWARRAPHVTVEVKNDWC